jgi:hypothetical protein
MRLRQFLFGGFTRPVGRAAPALGVLATAFISTLSASPALALSCLPSGPADAYLQAAESDSVYNVIAGSLRFDESLLPQSHSEDPADMPELSRIPAQLSGKMLEGRYFAVRVNVPVTLEVECAGPWCAGVKAGADYVVFAEQRGAELVVRFPACGGFVFDDSAQVRRQVLDCHRGKGCEPSMPR